MNHPTRLPLDFTEAAARKFKELIANEHNSNKKLRVYVEGVAVMALSICLL